MTLFTPQKRARGRVLTLGADARMMLPIIRSLGRSGVEVHAAGCPANACFRRSRYLARSHEIPGFDAPAADWLESLERLLRSHRFDLVIPATEPAVVALHEARDALAEFPIHLLNESTYRTAFDKSRTGALAQRLGIPMPDSQVVTDEREAEAFFRPVTGPVVAKPAHSLTCDQLASKQFVRIFEDASQCREWLVPQFGEGRTFVLQEWIPGSGVGVEFLARRGNILFAFQHRRLHETTGHGSTYRMSVSLDPHLLDATRRLVEALDYTGIGMCEFRVSEQPCRWAFLELNARFWGSLPLTLAAGANFPLFLYEMLRHGRTRFPADYRVGIRSRDFRPDLRWTWRTLRRRHADTIDQAIGWQMNPVSCWQALRDLARISFPSDRIDTFAADDPAPFFHELSSLASVCMKKRFSSHSRQPLGSTGGTRTLASSATVAAQPLRDAIKSDEQGLPSLTG